MVQKGSSNIAINIHNQIRVSISLMEKNWDVRQRLVGEMSGSDQGGGLIEGEGCVIVGGE